jgi:hypothetical protein
MMLCFHKLSQMVLHSLGSLSFSFHALGILKVVMLADDLKHLGSELKQMEWMLRNPWMESMLTPKFNFPADSCPGCARQWLGL